MRHCLVLCMNFEQLRQVLYRYACRASLAGSATNVATCFMACPIIDMAAKLTFYTLGTKFMMVYKLDTCSLDNSDIITGFGMVVKMFKPTYTLYMMLIHPDRHGTFRFANRQIVYSI